MKGLDNLHMVINSYLINSKVTLKKIIGRESNDMYFFNYMDRKDEFFFPQVMFVCQYYWMSICICILLYVEKIFFI